MGLKLFSRFGAIILLASGLFPAEAFCSNVKFTAEADRTEVFQDESVSLKLSIEVDGSLSSSQPEIDAPDFDVLNTYQSTYMQSVYENGKFGVRNTLQVTKVLRPRKTGKLAITGIQVSVGGTTHRSADIVVNVLPAGQGTPPPRSYGGTIGLKGAGRKIAKKAVMLRAEISKPEIYKGEQLIVSYYLYRTARVFNVQVVKFPVLEGFLREDLDLPVVRGAMDWETVTLDGVTYQRTLLARYAAYPLQEGELKIDQMTIKANYYGDDKRAPEDDDPFLQFFQQMTPRTTQERNETVSVLVKSLPENGKPARFKGAVGEFSAIAAVDKYKLRANEPVTLTVKLEGRGNISAFEEPSADWPEGVDLFEAKGRAKSGRGGVGQKVFEFLLIPRQAGTLTLPSLDFSYFDPARGEYVTVATQPVTLEVGAPAPGTAPVIKAPKVVTTGPKGKSSDSPTSMAEDIRYLKPPGSHGSGLAGRPWWRWSYWLGVAALFAFAAWIVSDQYRQAQVRRGANKGAEREREDRWRGIKARERALAREAGPEGLTRAYSDLAELLQEEIQRCTGVPARSYSREDLGRILVEEHGVSAAVWSSIEQILEYSENVRFGSTGGWIDPAEARRKYSDTVRDAERVSSQLAKR